MSQKLSLNNGDVIEMKAIKHAEFASEETYCFEGNLYLNGKKMAHISNDGRGGPNREDAYDGFSWKDIMAVNEACKETLPKWGSDLGDGVEYETDLEMWCTNQVTLFLDKKEFNKSIKKKILFIEGDEVMGMAYKGVNKIERKHVDFFKKTHKNVEVLNTMNKDDAFQIWLDKVA